MAKKDTGKKKDGDPPPSASLSKAFLPAPIPNNVRQYRKELGLSKVELARLSNLSEKTISRIEKEAEAFALTTYYKVRNGLNKARRNEGEPDLTVGGLFPTLKEEK